MCTFVCAWCGRVARTCRAAPCGAVTGERSPKELPCVHLLLCGVKRLINVLERLRSPVADELARRRFGRQHYRGGEALLLYPTERPRAACARRTRMHISRDLRAGACPPGDGP